VESVGLELVGLGLGLVKIRFLWFGLIGLGLLGGLIEQREVILRGISDEAGSVLGSELGLEVEVGLELELGLELNKGRSFSRALQMR
jgi:hypothetical protein